MNFFIKIAEFFGMFGKVKAWLQGKKTYAVNIAQALTGLSAMLAVSGQMIDLLVKTIGLTMGWADTSQGVGAATASVQQLWSDHAVMTAAFSAGLYAVMDALSKMAAYAASQRRATEIKAEVTPDGR